MAGKVVDGAVVARQAFFVGNKLVPGGQVWDADDPLVKAYGANFGPLLAQQSDPPKPQRAPKPAKAPARRSGSRKS